MPNPSAWKDLSEYLQLCPVTMPATGDIMAFGRCRRPPSSPRRLRPRLRWAVRDSGDLWLMRVLGFLLTLMLMFCLTGVASAADGDKRIALVIGIGTYKYAPELPNPPNDARAIGAALRKLDFEVEEDYD